MQAQATLINFTVTRDGLEEQLLAEVVATERPDLEKTKVCVVLCLLDCLCVCVCVWGGFSERSSRGAQGACVPSFLSSTVYAKYMGGGSKIRASPPSGQ